MKRFVCTLLEETEEDSPEAFSRKVCSGTESPGKKEKRRKPREKEKRRKPRKKEKNPAGGFYFEKTSSTSTLILNNLGESELKYGSQIRSFSNFDDWGLRWTLVHVGPK